MLPGAAPQVAEIMRLAQAAAAPVYGGSVLSLERMNRILEIDHGILNPGQVFPDA